MYTVLLFVEISWMREEKNMLSWFLNQSKKNHCVGLSFRRERMCDNFPQKHV